MDSAIVNIALPASTVQAFYRGQLTHVQAIAEDGRSIRLPLRSLQCCLSHAGLYGRFLIEFDQAGKCLRLERLS
jgi:hypothetical protein